MDGEIDSTAWWKELQSPKEEWKIMPLFQSTIVPLAKLGAYAHTGLSIVPSSPTLSLIFLT